MRAIAWAFLALAVAGGVWLLTERRRSPLPAELSGLLAYVSDRSGANALYLRRLPGGAGPVPPIAVVSATPSSGVAPLTVTFDGSASRDPDGTVTAWTWAFGDGTFGTASRTTHVYSTPGTFMASLTVTDTDGLSTTSSTAIVVTGRAPDAPTGLRATALSRTSIQLTWTNGSVEQSGIMIERCQGSACTAFVQIGMAPGTATSVTDTGLARRTTYTYRVRARNVFGESPYSNTASARTNR